MTSGKMKAIITPNKTSRPLYMKIAITILAAVLLTVSLFSEQEKQRILPHDLDKLPVSAHKDLVCSACHLDFKNNQPPPPPAELRRAVCIMCHMPQSRLFRKSIHYGVTIGDPARRMTCKDCHGWHDIYAVKNPEARVFPGQQTATCSRCHEDGALIRSYGLKKKRRRTYSGSFHGKALTFGDLNAPGCSGCHGYHGIRPASDPESAIHPDNLAQTCGRCHSGAGKNYTRGTIHTLPRNSSQWAVWIKLAHGSLIAAFLLISLLYILFDLLHHRRNRNPPPPSSSALSRDKRMFLRMTKTQRLQHFLMIFSVLLLTLTGIPLMFPRCGLVHILLPGSRSFFVRSVLHRIGAVLLIGDTLWIFLYSLLTKQGRSNLKGRLFRKRDLIDFLQLFGYKSGFPLFLHKRGFLGKLFDRHPGLLCREGPRFGRYSVVNKFEFWAMLLGSLIMIGTGIFLWFEEFSLSLFPLWVHHIFYLVHSYEAVLAVLAILIWHMYSVHLNSDVFPMSRIWLTGKITAQQLKKDHPLEYEEMETKVRNKIP
jgi:cytochrome b subunit of formate dehydrogenase